jgi:hypothetical protein
MRSPIWLTAVATLLLSASLASQVRVVRYGDDRLAGIDEVDVLVTEESDGRGCPFTRPTAQERAVGALRAANIKATSSDKARSSHYSVVIEVERTETPTVCASAITTELVAEVSGIPEAERDLPPGTWGSLLVGVMPLARDKALVIGPALEHDAAVQRAIESQVEALAARIRSAIP